MGALAAPGLLAYGDCQTRVVRVASDQERDAKSSLANGSDVDDDDRDTNPAPDPKARERLDPTPRMNRTQRSEGYARTDELRPEPPRGDLLDQVMAQMTDV